jgi:predicted lipid-binding transport protein (Tim44 family)
VLGADAQAVVHMSKDSDLVFLPVFLRNHILYLFRDTPVEAVVSPLQTVAMCSAAQPVDLDAEPDEGRQAELAQLFDQLHQAEKRVENAEKLAYRASKAANEIMADVDIEQSLASKKVLQSLKKALSAREDARRANRKAKVERAKLADISEKVKKEET